MSVEFPYPVGLVTLDVKVNYKAGFASASLPFAYMSDTWTDKVARKNGAVAEVHFSYKPIDHLREGWREYYNEAVDVVKGHVFTHAFLLHLICVVSKSSAMRHDDDDYTRATRGLGARLLAAVLRELPSPSPDSVIFMLEADGSIRTPLQYKEALRVLATVDEETLERELVSHGIRLPLTNEPTRYRERLEDRVEHLQANADLVHYYTRKLALVPITQHENGEVLMAAPIRSTIQRLNEHNVIFWFMSNVVASPRS